MEHYRVILHTNSIDYILVHLKNTQMIFYETLSHYIVFNNYQLYDDMYPRWIFEKDTGISPSVREMLETILYKSSPIPEFDYLPSDNAVFQKCVEQFFDPTLLKWFPYEPPRPNYWDNSYESYYNIQYRCNINFIAILLTLWSISDEELLSMMQGHSMYEAYQWYQYYIKLPEAHQVIELLKRQPFLSDDYNDIEEEDILM